MRMDPFQYLQNRMNQLWKEFDREISPFLTRNPQIQSQSQPQELQLAQSQLQSQSQQLQPFQSGGFILPAIKLDVKETPDSVFVSADLPGVPKESIQATVDEDGLLNISAEKREEHAEAEPQGRWAWRERQTGRVQRAIQLPRSIDAGKAAHAEFKDGVLQLKFPKRPEKQGQAIEIK